MLKHGENCFSFGNMVHDGTAFEIICTERLFD